MIEDTRRKGIISDIVAGERERTSHTTRGWWIGWMRLEGVILGSGSPITDKKAAHSRSTSGDCSNEVLTSGNAGELTTVSTQQESEDDAMHTSIVHTGRREAFIIRKSSDHSRSHSRQVSKDNDINPSRISEGLGIDPRRYFEQLLNFSART